MERFDLTTLRLFRVVAEETNIARAAAREHIAASAISKRLQELELDLGTPLFYRHQKGVELTPAGRALYLHTRSMFSLLDRMQSELQEYAGGVKGHVRVSANTSSIVQFLPAILKRFLSAYPQVKIQLQEEVSETSIRLVRDGVVDIGLITASIPADGLDLIPFRSDRICLLVRDDHPLAQHDAISFEETFPHDQVGLEERSAIQIMVTTAAEEKHHALNLKVRVASFDGLRYLVQAGIGIGFLPEACVRPYEQSMGLKGITLTDSWADRSLSICARNKSELSVTALALVQELLP